MSRWGVKVASAVFGGDPKENARRYNANADLRALADLTMPWTKKALIQAVEDWLEREKGRGGP